MIQAGYRTDKGKTRELNQDAFCVILEEGVFVVADGVGGHNAGEVASNIATSHIAEYIKVRPIKDMKNDDELKAYFEDCLRLANGLVRTVANSAPENKGMATTIVLAYIDNENAYVINIGDSRAYLVRQGRMMQITEDHTFVGELVKEGTITTEEAAFHPNKNMITRALGGERTVRPDFYQIEVEPGDRILLCTDGLYNEVSEDTICSMASEIDSVDELAEQYITLANMNGGSDNITVVAIQID